MYPYHRNYLSQQNLISGIMTAIASSDLTGLEGYLVKANRIAAGVNTGKLGADLVSANLDTLLYVLVEGGGIGTKVKLAPLIDGESYKIKMKSAGVNLAVLSLADVATPADKGKLRTLPVTTGTYRQLFTAEEDWVDGQLAQVRCTRYLGTVVVP